MAKWMHPEAGECEVFPQDENDERALRGMGMRPVEDKIDERITLEVQPYTETCVDAELLPDDMRAPKPRKSRKG